MTTGPTLQSFFPETDSGTLPRLCTLPWNLSLLAFATRFERTMAAFGRGDKGCCWINYQPRLNKRECI